MGNDMEIKKRRVVITGMGAISPIGNTYEENRKAIYEGKCGIAPITYFDTTDSKVKVAGEIKDLHMEDYIPAKEIRRMDKFVSLALIATKQALEASGLLAYEEWNKKRTGTLVATGIGGILCIEEQHSKFLDKGMRGISPFFVPGGISNIAAARVAIEYGLKGSSSCVITACAGGTNAVGDSFRLIRDGYQDIMVCGGTECSVSEFSIGGFNAIKALSTEENPSRASIPFDADRGGFVMGEGAGMLVLEELEHAIKRNAPIYAEVVGYASNCDAFHITAPAENGEGAAECMEMAIEDAGIKKEQIKYINAHGTSTKMNDCCETRALKTAFGDHAKDLLISSTKSMTGHLLGASGAIEAIYTAIAVNEDYAPPTINYCNPDPNCDLNYVPNNGVHETIEYAMSNSLGFGGHNASIILKKYKK